jgi:hypothetical protein
VFVGGCSVGADVLCLVIGVKVYSGYGRPVDYVGVRLVLRLMGCCGRERLGLLCRSARQRRERWGGVGRLRELHRTSDAR